MYLTLGLSSRTMQEYQCNVHFILLPPTAQSILILDQNF
jgi:hypothetical protein